MDQKRKIEYFRNICSNTLIWRTKYIAGKSFFVYIKRLIIYLIVYPLTQSKQSLNTVDKLDELHHISFITTPH